MKRTESAIRVDGKTIDSDAVGEMTRSLRRSAVYSQWDTPPTGRRVTTTNIEDVGAYLHDPRWAGWAARVAVRRLSDEPGSGYRRWRTTVRVAMPGWFANLYAVYVDVRRLELAGEARAARSALTTDRELEARALREVGLKLSQITLRMFGPDPSDSDRRQVSRWLAGRLPRKQ